MEAYAYAAPSSIAEVTALLQEHANDGRPTQILAGGTDVLVQMRSSRRAPRTIVDIKRLQETNRLEVSQDQIYIGSAVPSARMQENSELKALYPGLLEAADLIGSTQVQGRATICGNLCNASPAGDSIPALIAAGAVCDIATQSGAREMAVERFVVGVGRNALADGEFLLGVKLPRPGVGTKDAYLRFTPRTEMDIAVAGVGVSVTVQDGICSAARVAIGAVATTALLVPDAAKALIGSTLDDDALQAAGNACQAAAQPISDKRGSAAYRKKIVAVLCRRAVQVAGARAIER
ncbi:MAG: xanthine dehydrogenase family protein subunit M [Pseudomonadota bacterium]|nr:xanthine dehydrogenase family protein subunit M [Pseudomonadota bacterium]MEC7553956.1 xanthine dehydrogenase family protein subunit M [Pseudomonadota bacterium]MEC7970685.1 xanthine dehydrogenase family protein subunit M [Pseudomonadota bacterium]MEC7993960.1 xanthine dehydrogenase family protein subunit M [Pseudomonadota bacterium]MEC8348337.1 xanthine dehydrogenase family protein subunit M [Pseudomonadota bacterium]